MAFDAEAKRFHTEQSMIARRCYLASGSPEIEAADWYSALRQSRQQIAQALRDSHYLADIPQALRTNGAHMLVFRNMAAPPISQDQFKLICASWNKGTEKPGRKVSDTSAIAVALAIEHRFNRALVRWIKESRRPFQFELKQLFGAISPLLASQQLATAKRNRRAAAQEGKVIEMLLIDGWVKDASKQIDKRAALPLRHFMHKTRFATKTSPQEVDIACGLGDTVVLAMECKVTNDETNSVKRINDVLKKATGWKEHWGSFVKPAALLQGVIRASDVHRLLDAEIQVFWSHDLDRFKDWLSAEIK